MHDPDFKVDLAAAKIMGWEQISLNCKPSKGVPHFLLFQIDEPQVSVSLSGFESDRRRWSPTSDANDEQMVRERLRGFPDEVKNKLFGRLAILALDYQTGDLTRAAVEVWAGE